MENRGEERDISATQGEERGGEVNAPKGSSYRSLFWVFTARSMIHVLDLRMYVKQLLTRCVLMYIYIYIYSDIHQA